MIVTITMTPALLSVLGRPRSSRPRKVADARVARAIGWLAASTCATGAHLRGLGRGHADRVAGGHAARGRQRRIKSTLPLDSEARSTSTQ
jgi:hypothetical protein